MNKTWFYALTLALLGSTAHAQSATRATQCDPATPNNAICVVITPPATMVDGSPTILPMTYRIEQKVGTGAFTTIATALATPKFYVKNLAPGTYIFRGYALCSPGCTESGASNEASRDATAPVVQPNPPVIIVAVTIRADGPPIFRKIGTIVPKEGEIVLVLPEEAKVLFVSR